MLRRILAALPPNLLRFVGRAQFKVPLLRPVIEATARRFASAEAVIRHGVGAGLRFNATGGAAGYLLGTSEIEEQELLAQLLNPGDTFYDIGANVGFYSTIAARLVGPLGRVYAFEPFGPSAERALSNARLNGFDNVTVIQAAVAAEPGPVRLYTQIGRQSQQYRVGSDVDDGFVEVPSVSIDIYATQHGLRAPTLVMVDVEGGEIDVLRGMLATIREYRPIIMCEVHWTGEAFRDFVEANLKELGYRATTYSGHSLPVQKLRYHALVVPPDKLRAR